MLHFLGILYYKLALVVYKSSRLDMSYSRKLSVEESADGQYVRIEILIYWKF